MKKVFNLFALAAAATLALVSCGKEDNPSSTDPSGIYLNKKEMSVMVGESETLEVSGLADGVAATFTSQDTKIASVGKKSGKVTGKAVGETTIEVTAGDWTGTCKVTVTEKLNVVTAVSIGSDFTLDEGATKQLAATLTPANATNIEEAQKTLVWSSDNEKVATVKDGLVTAQAVEEGSTEKARITATVTSNGKEYSGSVTVTVTSSVVLVTGVDLGAEITLNEGGTRQLSPAIVPANATDKDAALKTIKYSTSDATVATVSATGLVTAQNVAEGETKSATITATVTSRGKEYSGTVKVNVTSNVIPTTALVMSKGSLKLNPGESTALSVNITPANHTDSPVIEWSSSDTGVAKVSGSGESVTVEAVTYGSAVITAKVQGKDITATATVTVADGPKAAYPINMSSTYFEYTWPESLSSLENVTLEAWVNIGSSSSEQSFLGTEGVFLIRAQSGNFQAVTGGGSASGWTQSTETVLKSTSEAGEWHHVAATYTASSKKVILYVDGAQVAEGEALIEGALPMNGIEGYNDGTNPNIFMVGNGYGRNRYLNGNIAYARVWKKACTAAEIAANMNKENVSGADLIAYWKFDEGNGNTVKDYSGAGRDLSPVEGTLTWEEGTLPTMN